MAGIDRATDYNIRAGWESLNGCIGLNAYAVTITAFWFMLATVILLGVFLAWVKHFAYTHFTTYRAIAGVMVTLIGFALLAEMFAALEDQKAKADIQLSGNAAYQATIQPTVGAITVSPALAADIANAKRDHIRCLEKLKAGKVKYCVGDKGYTDSLAQQQKAILEAQVQATAATEKLRYERQDQMKADAHNDFIVSIAKFYAGIFGTGAEKDYVGFISWANITLMLIIAIAFERLHAFLIEAGRNIKGNIRGLERSIASLRDGGEDYPAPRNKTLFQYQQQPADGGYKSTTPGFGFSAKTQQGNPVNHAPVKQAQPVKPTPPVNP